MNTTSVTNPNGYLGETGEVVWVNDFEELSHDTCRSVLELLTSQEVTDTTSRAHEMGLSRRRVQGTSPAPPDLESIQNMEASKKSI